MHRRLAAALLVAAVGLGAASPAFASDDDDGPTVTSTTPASSSPGGRREPRPPATVRRPDTPRPSTSVGKPSVPPRPVGAPATSLPATGSSTVPTTPGTSAGPGVGASGEGTRTDAAGALRQLALLADKLAAAGLDPATASTLATRIATVRAAIDAGQAPGAAGLGTLLRDAHAALETAERDDRPVRPDAAARAAEVLNEHIARINASDLPDTAKAAAVAALQQALANVTDPGQARDAVAAVRDELERRKADRFTEIRTRMTGALDKVAAAIEQAAAAGADPAAVTTAQNALAAARDALAVATTPEELRTVWTALRDARLALTGGTTTS